MLKLTSDIFKIKVHLLIVCFLAQVIARQASSTDMLLFLFGCYAQWIPA